MESPKMIQPERPGPEELHDYSEDGVDLTLIRWMLSLSPEERLQVLQDTVQSLMRLRDARRCG
jgi:hypothetical protein